MSKNFIHSTRFRILWPLIHGIIVYILLLLFFDNLEQILSNFFNGELYLCIFLSFLNSELLRLYWVIINASKKGISAGRNAIIILGGFTVTVVSIASLISLYFIYLINYSWGVFELELYTFLFLYGISTLLLATVYVSFNLLYNENRKKIDEEDTFRLNLEHRVQTFRNNINPSFFYQSMESLILMLYRDDQTADRFLYHLSLIYRYILENKDEELKSLKDEIGILESLEFVLSHGGLKPIMFINKLSTEDLNGNHLLVTNSINTYIAYLVNNSMLSSELPYQIIIYVEDNYLVLESDLQDRFIKDMDAEKRHSMLKATYEYFTPRPIIHLRKSTKRFDKIPLLQLENNAQSLKNAV